MTNAEFARSTTPSLDGPIDELRRANALDAAEQRCRELLRAAPDSPQVADRLGRILEASGRWQEARSCFERAVEAWRRILDSAPDVGDGYAGLSKALRHLGRVAEAAQEARRGLERQPSHHGCRRQLSNALVFAGRYEEAISMLRQVLEADPHLTDAEMNLGIACLATGRFDEGWRHYEARLAGGHAWWLTKHMPRSNARWDGRNAGGKTLLFHAEQGIGDTLQFVRFLPMIRAMGARIILRVPGKLVRLLRPSFPEVELVSLNDPVPGFDAWAPLLSLGHLLKVTPAMLPGTIPYLMAEPELRAAWHKRLGPRRAAVRAGLCWEANPAYQAGKDRSLPLEALAPIASVPNVELYSLQFGAAANKAASLDAFDIVSFGKLIGPFENLAALMCELDLVISVDTANVHLAGALGVPCWVLLPTIADWRWLLERDDSPWYPGMRLFRRDRLTDQVNAVAEALLSAVRARIQPERSN
jgi:Tetratricopeptide repeat